MPYIFVVVDGITAKIVRNAYAILLNVNNVKKQIFQHTKTSVIPKMYK